MVGGKEILSKASKLQFEVDLKIVELWSGLYIYQRQMNLIDTS
jgi:hypothetical protein